MIRALLFLFLLALAGCVPGPTTPKSGPTSPCPSSGSSPTPSPGSTTTAGAAVDRSNPQAAVCTLYSALRGGECEQILAGFTSDVAAKLVEKAGSRDALCRGYRDAADQVVRPTEVVGTAIVTEEPATATVLLKVKDATGHESASVVSLVRDAEAWKVSRLSV